MKVGTVGEPTNVGGAHIVEDCGGDYTDVGRICVGPYKNLTDLGGEYLKTRRETDLQRRWVIDW